MRHAIARWVAPILAAGLCGIAATPAHAQGACNPGDTLLWSQTRQVGNMIVREDHCAKTPGPWAAGELDRAIGVLKAMPETPAKAWVLQNVALVRKHDTPVCVINLKGKKVCDAMPSPYAGLHDGQAQLIFNDSFFSETPAVQKSLFAFESGKAFYLKLDLGARFNAYAPAMDEMLRAGKVPANPMPIWIRRPSLAGCSGSRCCKSPPMITQHGVRR